MEEKYVIFSKRDAIRPISLIDKIGNSMVMELSKDDAIKYVNENNAQYGEGFFWFEKLSDWQKRLQSPQMNAIYDKMDEICDDIYKQLMDSDDIRSIVEKDYLDKDKNINGFQIPFVANNNEDYEIKLKEKLESFIKEIDRPAFKREGNLVEDVKTICRNVIKSFNAVKAGENEEAEKLVSDILKEYKKYSFAVSELDQSYAFRGIAPFMELRSNIAKDNEYEEMLSYELSLFRARVVGAEEELHEIEEINYLPYSKRFLAKDMRFSSKGKVCFYLGTTSYVCSEECRWNEKDNLYLSSVKFNEKGKQLKILNLVVLQALMNGLIPRDEKNLLQKELHNAMIRVFPLVIATMFTIKASDDERKNLYGETTKYEYLLSQILMNVLKKEGIDGVAYLSRQGKDDFQYPQMVCLAIPVTDNDSENEYGDLINYYNMTKPVLFNNLDVDTSFERKSYINRNYPVHLKYDWGEMENYSAKVHYKSQEIFYQQTPFSRIDDYIINQEYYNLAPRII